MILSSCLLDQKSQSCLQVSSLKTLILGRSLPDFFCITNLELCDISITTRKVEKLFFDSSRGSVSSFGGICEAPGC